MVVTKTGAVRKRADPPESGGSILGKTVYRSQEWKDKISAGLKGNLGNRKHPPRKQATCDHPDRKAKGHGLCDSCYRKWYYAQNPEKEIKRSLIYQRDPAHREKVLAQKRKYDNKPEVKAYAKEYKKRYRAEHREQIRIAHRAYRAKRRARERKQSLFPEFKKWWSDNFLGMAQSVSRRGLAYEAFKAGNALRRKRA